MIEGLTIEQQNLEKEFGIKFVKNNKGKLEIQTTPEYEKYLIEKEFNDTVKQLTKGYSQAEIDTWNTKVEEAKKVVAGGTSTLLSSLLIQGEVLLDFANMILIKAEALSIEYCKAEKLKREKLISLNS